MEFLLLGQIDVVHDATSLPLGGPRNERIVARLALDVGHLVTVAQLVDVVWPVNPPATAADQVQNCVGTIRRRLISHGLPPGRLARARCGYVLGVDSGQVDAHRFGALISGARRLAADGRDREAVGVYRAADELWHGPALAGIHDGHLYGESIRLEELRITAVEDRISLELGLAMHRECTSDLFELCAHHPVRERLHGELMLALHRSGRTVEALAVYEKLRALLSVEYGLDPGPDLREFHGLILADGAGLAAVASFGAWQAARSGAVQPRAA